VTTEAKLTAAAQALAEAAHTGCEANWRQMAESDPARQPGRAGGAAVKRLVRFLCARRGHSGTVGMLALPEDGWGLYAYSRLTCSRCGAVIHEPDIWAALARYNTERAHGIVHDPEYAKRMAIQQAYFDERPR
jgi:hypothetical protein